MALGCHIDLITRDYKLYITGEPMDIEARMERDDDDYTKDGTVDIYKKPANKKKTGTWKACPFILGMVFVYPYK